MSSQSSSSQLLEYVVMASCFTQCFLLMLNSEDRADMELATASFHMSLMMHIFTLLAVVINMYWRGTRVHLYPLMMGFILYSLAFFFGIYQEITYYYYYLTVLVSIAVSFFFGSTDYYTSFETSGQKNKVGCIMTSMKVGGNRVMIYYPTPKNSKGQYNDYKWAYDGEHTIKGLMKFGADILPQGPFNHLTSIRQNVLVNAPVSRGDKTEKGDEKKFVPVIFSHGIGNTMSFFSTIFKDLASQGHIVFSLEHNDRTALHHYADD